MEHLTRLFPKIKVNLGEVPSDETILRHGFDIKITHEIKEKICNMKVGDYLVAYPATDETGNLVGINLKLKSGEVK